MQIHSHLAKKQLPKFSELLSQLSQTGWNYARRGLPVNNEKIKPKLAKITQKWPREGHFKLKNKVLGAKIKA
ncbi:hypothetical protein NXS98_11675 [Fontisphaera persica]|uniref:hypothetical protein n=1 Tax=Fontisphaera persica TaxID=2974023 RepID=UPI0024BFA13F|nr:hypothetical protein [Fontisphaera persica]WCJ58381.1 hypothetical protein NXS98_11675 [Fontisphaera persica]